MASPAEIIRACLVDQKLVSFPPDMQTSVPISQIPGDNSTVCFVGLFPDDPDQIVFIDDVSGVLWGRPLDGGAYWTHPGVKVLVRALDYGKGNDLVNAIAGGMASLKRTTTTLLTDGPHTVLSVYQTGTVNHLGQDTKKRRELWSINARVVLPDSEPSF